MNKVKDYIPHREPFLFVDDIIEVSNSNIKTKKYISSEEYYFKGHYPNYPLMPGVLICESILQSGAVLIAHITEENIKDDVPVVTRMNNIKFKKMVLPGNTIEMSVELIDKKSNVYYLKGVAKVDQKLVLSLDFACGLVKKEAMELK
ncbi:MAG: 3-hydroxyacyl-ACP dehydratase FabZ [Nitrospirae bacterium]|nr:3-hydroxyacyl-ACP dehydratase FabZ [Nitrospirota bacterium]